MKRLLIKLPNWMGDILFSYDLLNSLASNFRETALVTSIKHRELFDIFPIPHARVIAYPPESWPRFESQTVKQMEDFHADATLVLPNSIGAALVMRYAGRAPLYGYATEHRGFLMSKSLPQPAARIHQNQYYLELLRLFDIAPQPYEVLPKAATENLVVIHPGASKMERAWHLDRFLDVAQRLSQDGFQVVFVSGEPMSVNGFEHRIQPSLKEFVHLLNRAALFIGNDSGPLHLAQQAGAPVIGIYGPGNPLTTGPRPMTSHRVVYHAFPCSPCRQRFFKECAPSDNNKPFCLETIRLEEVLKAARDLIRSVAQPI